MARISSLRLKQRAEAGAALIIRDWSGKPDEKTGELPPLLSKRGTPVTITVQGIDSPTARRLANRRAAKLQSQAYQTVAVGGNAAQIEVSEADIAEIEATTISDLCELTLSWDGFEDDHDEDLPCTADNARELYEQCVPIRDQVYGFYRDRARFFASSAAPSVRTPNISSPSDELVQAG